jgi:hypothetical protein
MLLDDNYAIKRNGFIQVEKNQYSYFNIDDVLKYIHR